MSKAKKIWHEAFGVCFHRLSAEEKTQYELILTDDKDLNGVTKSDIYRAVVNLGRSRSFEGFKPTPNDIKREIMRMRGKAGAGSVKFDLHSAHATLKEISDPIERWEWIMSNTPETSKSASETIPLLIRFCQGLPGGINRPKMKSVAAVVGQVDKTVRNEDGRISNTEWERRRQDAHNKLQGR